MNDLFNQLYGGAQDAGTPPQGVPNAAAAPNADVVGQLLGGIAQRETGGQRDPYGTVVNAGKGRLAVGKYQILNTNIPAWTKAALGRPMTVAEFAADPEAQDATARYQLGQYVEAYGPEGAAQAWLGGPGSVGKVNRTDRFGTSVGQYGTDVMRNAGLAPGAGAPPAPRSSAAADILNTLLSQHTAAPQAAPAAAPQTAAAPSTPQPTAAGTPPWEQPTATPSAPTAPQTASETPPWEQPSAPAPTPTPAPNNAPAASSATPADPGRLMALQAGTNAVLGGLPNYLTAGVAGLNAMIHGQPFSYGGALHQLGQQEALAAQNHPYYNMGGMALGAGPAIYGMGKLPGATAESLLGRIGFGTALGGAAGASEAVSNSGALSSAAPGAITGAVGGAAGGLVAPWVVPLAGAGIGGYGAYQASGGNPVATAAGAVGGAVGGKRAEEIAAPAVQRLTGTVTGPLRRGYAALAPIMRQEGESMSAAASRILGLVQEFKQKMGFMPTPTQLLEQQQAAELGAKLSGSPSALATARQAEQTGADALQTQQQTAILGGHAPETQEGLDNFAKTHLDAVMKRRGTAGVPVEDTPVPVAALLPAPDNPKYGLALGALTRLVHAKAGEESGEALANALSTNGTLPLRRVDDIRQWARDAAASPKTPQDFEPVYEGLRTSAIDAAGNASPEYKQGFAEYSALRRRGAGAAVGAQGVTATPEAFVQAQQGVRNASGALANQASAGVGPGLRTELAENSTQGAAGAAKTAKEIVHHANVAANMQGTLPPNETQRIQRVGQLSERAGAAMSQLAAGKATKEAQQALSVDAAARAGTYGLLQHHFGMLQSLHQMVQHAGLGDKELTRLAQIAADPKQTPSIVAYLKQRGLKKADAVDAVRMLGVLGGSSGLTNRTAP